MVKQKIYVIENELMMSKWDYKENNKEELYPEMILKGSHKKAHFICPVCNEKWVREIRREYNGNGCPICGVKIKTEHWIKTRLKNTNSLFVTHPELEKEWDYEKNRNEGLDPNYLMAGSNKNANWICPEGHTYKTQISNRALRHTGCKYCAGQAVWIGFNDLQTISPELAKEWSNKNKILPTQVTAKSNKKVFWVCPLGHADYLMSVKQRGNRQGCPICAQQSQTSFPEQAIYYYIKQLFSDAINRYIYNGKEIDIFIPSKKIGIEYNGYFSHKNKTKRDLDKKIYFESQNIKIIVVKEYKDNYEKVDADFYINERTSYLNLNELIKNILDYVSPKHSLTINCEKDSIHIKEQYFITRKENSIAVHRPDLVQQWDFERNGKITPEMISLGTGHRYYWKCRICNNSYLALPSSIAKGSVCSKHRNLLKPGINDFATRYPELLKYWDYEKNIVKPSEIYGGGEKIINWVCEKGHSYQKMILKIIRGERCPYCKGKKVLEGFNDLGSLFPEVASSWNYKRNGTITPSQVTAHSNKKFWWICDKGHEWESGVNNRTNGRGCPVCYNLERHRKK